MISFTMRPPMKLWRSVSSRASKNAEGLAAAMRQR